LQNTKQHTVRDRAIASLSGRDRRYWHVASPRVSELRGPRTSLVSLTLSGGDISIFASSPNSPFHEKTRKSRLLLEISSFDIDHRWIDENREETRNPW